MHFAKTQERFNESIDHIIHWLRSAVSSESDCRSRGGEFDPAQSYTFLEIDHAIISMVILLPLIQEGLLSVTSKSMCTKHWLTA